MTTINSRNKGAAAERELAGLIHDWAGVRLVRNLEQSRSGGHDLTVHDDDSGPIADAFRQLAIECKRYESATDGSLQKWWTQALAQAELVGRLPVLAYRTNRAAWRVVVPLALVNGELCDSRQLDYTATLSVKGFCHVMTDGAGLPGAG